MTLPLFTAEGLLPPGDYPMTLEDLRRSMLVQGPGDGRPWDARWRAQLVENLALLVPDLWQEGVDEIFIDGSFVEDKAQSGDIDGYFACGADAPAFLNLYRRLRARNPIWSWTKIRDPHTGKDALPMWHRYRIELYPHYGQPAGPDRFGTPLVFPSFFRQTRGGQPKGIVQIVRPVKALASTAPPAFL